jgi:ABC-type multidrug transport system ATPase subunit
MLPCAFVEQENNFFPHMTVRETLSFRVELKLGNRISKKARDELVNGLIEELQLEKAADTIVGDNKARGISGGERRRLAIACELIFSPSVIFLDEPTSGKLTIYRTHFYSVASFRLAHPFFCPNFPQVWTVLLHQVL